MMKFKTRIDAGTGESKSKIKMQKAKFKKQK